MSEWIEVKYRELTDEEREMYGEECEFIYDCRLPEDGEEVLITTDGGLVRATTFYNDDCAYFEGWEDKDEVVAWMPFPEPYKKSEVKDDN